MDAMDRLARDAANQLQGTCKGIADLGEEFEAAQNDDVFCRALDSLVFCCERCEWWSEVSEARTETGSGWICWDCDGDDEDDYE